MSDKEFKEMIQKTTERIFDKLDKKEKKVFNLIIETCNELTNEKEQLKIWLEGMIDAKEDFWSVVRVNDVLSKISELEKNGI